MTRMCRTLEVVFRENWKPSIVQTRVAIETGSGKMKWQIKYRIETNQTYITIQKKL